MLPYWIFFLVPALLAIARLRPVQNRDPRWPGSWWVAFVLLVLVVGLRHEVGMDWGNYAEQLRLASYDSFQSAITQVDPAYSLLNWAAAQFDLELHVVNTVCAAFFAWGVVVFCRAQPRPWLALVVAVPYLVTVVAMGYTRQGVAIGLVMIGLVALSERRILRFVIFVALAATFHKSAVVLIPLAALADSRNRVWTALWVSLATLLFYFLLLQESVEGFNAVYIEAEYNSAGAAIRVAMNAVPAVLFLLFRRQFPLLQSDRAFWTWMAFGGLAFVPLLIVSPSSTAVDRLALYWIPLQLFVLSRLPDALGHRNGQNALWVCSVVAYSGAVLFVWLVFADNAFGWLPYQFYPWVMLWR